MNIFARKSRLLLALTAVLAVCAPEVVAQGASSSGTFTDARDGKTYKTVRIGDQVWMARNLNYQTGDSWCYDNNNSNCEKYGRLYKWNTARAACPSGWHLPSREEWGRLAKAAGGTGDYGTEGAAGKMLKSASGWKASGEKDGNGSDGLGFSALSGGTVDDMEGEFYGVETYGGWWTSTEDRNSGSAYVRSMLNDEDKLSESGGGGDPFSVRCVADAPDAGGLGAVAPDYAAAPPVAPVAAVPPAPPAPVAAVPPAPVAPVAAVPPAPVPPAPAVPPAPPAPVPPAPLTAEASAAAPAQAAALLETSGGRCADDHNTDDHTTAPSRAAGKGAAPLTRASWNKFPPKGAGKGAARLGLTYGVSTSNSPRNKSENADSSFDLSFDARYGVIDGLEASLRMPMPLTRSGAYTQTVRRPDGSGVPRDSTITMEYATKGYAGLEYPWIGVRYWRPFGVGFFVDFRLPIGTRDTIWYVEKKDETVYISVLSKSMALEFGAQHSANITQRLSFGGQLGLIIPFEDQYHYKDGIDLDVGVELDYTVGVVTAYCGMNMLVGLTNPVFDGLIVGEVAKMGGDLLFGALISVTDMYGVDVYFSGVRFGGRYKNTDSAVIGARVSVNF